MRKDDLIKDIINILCKYYECNIEEFFSLHGNEELWGVSKINNEYKEYIVFVDEQNFNNLNVQLIPNENNSYEMKLIKVLMLDNDSRGKSNWHVLAENSSIETIVVDKDAKEVLHYSPYGANVAMIINKILSFIKNTEVQERKKEFSIITYVLIIANIIMYILTAFLSGSILNINSTVLAFLGAKVNTLIEQGQYYRLVTSMFLHGGLIHLAANMYALNIIGPAVEKAFGKVKYILIYFIGGIVGSLCSYRFSEAMSIGASGAIFALLGATLVFLLKMRDKFGKSMVKNILSVIGTNIFIGLVLPNIDNFAHIGGLVGGIVVSLALYPVNIKK